MALGGKLGLVFIAWDDTCIDIHHPWNPALTWRRKHPLSMFCLCQKTDWGPKETEPLKKKYQRNYKRVPKQHKRGKNHWKKEKLSQKRSKGSKLPIKGQIKHLPYQSAVLSRCHIGMNFIQKSTVRKTCVGSAALINFSQAAIWTWFRMTCAM